MDYPDLINGSFELAGSWFTWRNAYQMWLDREVKGVYWPATGFFAAWGLWNIFYYSHLDQPLSWWAGLVLVAGNIAWVGLYLYFRGASKEKAHLVPAPGVRCWHDGGTCHHHCVPTIIDGHRLGRRCFRVATGSRLTVPWEGFPVRSPED